MRKVLYFDVEWANSQNKSICQMGLISEDFDTGEPILPELNIYVDPEDKFDRVCMEVHHITFAKVKGCKNFPEIWAETYDYFINSVIIGHNVKSADLNALVKNLQRYNIDIPELWYIDTYSLARHLIDPILVNNYTLSTLCEFFEIDMDNEHDAFDDACACSDLLSAIINRYHINIDDYTEHYSVKDICEIIPYTSSLEYRREINQLYGVISGIEMDNKINDKEYNYLVNWRHEHNAYQYIKSVKHIFNLIDLILEDGVVTIDELDLLKNVIITYLQLQQSSKETLATQYLQGLIIGIKADEKIQDIEVYKLQQWLYQNIYLSGHYPYDKLIGLLEDILKDDIITAAEKEELNDMFEELLDPLKKIQDQVIKFVNKAFCLSGNFIHGTKSDIEQYICSKGGVIDKNVKRTTDYLVVGGKGSDEYSNGTYGTKVKKAKELGKAVLKEEQIFK